MLSLAVTKCKLRASRSPGFCNPRRLQPANSLCISFLDGVCSFLLLAQPHSSRGACYCHQPQPRSLMSCAATTTAPPAEADPAHEVFDLVDESGNVTGQAPRSLCHKSGLLHRAVYVFVFDTKGRLLVQRRSPDKKIGPGQWDLSVAEHLSQGETFHQAACRGLLEELGISAVVPDVPLGPMHRRSLVVPGLYIDNELVQSYRVDGFDGQVQWNAAEVSEVQYIELADLQAQMAAEPDKFTEWFRQEIEMLNFFVVPGNN